MSVSLEQKTEIIEHTYKSSCCRRAILSGILFAKANCEGKRITLSLSKAEYADFTAKLVSEFYGKAEIYRPSSGGRSIFVSFDSPSASKYLSELDKLSKFDINLIFPRKCQSCLSAFLRGVFLASGRLSDPKKQYALEFSLGNRTETFAEVLRTLGMNPLISHKKSGEILYFRKGDEIEEFYGHAGLNSIVFEVIERKITSLARRESQRYLNCVTNNYDKMTAVSERQIAIISKLDEFQLLSSLPEELERTARLKLQYPDLPLSLLAAQMVPAISKSGLSHRLKKIEEVGARLLKLTDE